MSTTDEIRTAAGGGAVEHGQERRGGGKQNVFLWILQVLLALLFLWAGFVKLSMPAAELARVSPLPVPFLEFIGVVEMLGGIGLVVPWLTGIRPGLTPLAAAGLVVIMIGAVVSTLATAPAYMAVVPLVVGVAAAFVAYGRWRLVPHRRSS